LLPLWQSRVRCHCLRSLDQSKPGNGLSLETVENLKPQALTADEV
jgi:hypothetical protein